MPPPELQRSEMVVALAGVAIPALQETGLTEVSPARATIDSVRIKAAE